MSLVARVRRLVPSEVDALGRDRLVLYECRHCGTTFDDEEPTCPVCGRSEIARYDLA